MSADGIGKSVQSAKDKEAALLLTKFEDYGPRNIADAPGGPLNGLAVRLHDKVARLAHLLTSRGEPNHESLGDTFLDIANYGTIGQLVLAGDWPGTQLDAEELLESVVEALQGDVEQLAVSNRLLGDDLAAARRENRELKAAAERAAFPLVNVSGAKR